MSVLHSKLHLNKIEYIDFNGAVPTRKETILCRMDSTMRPLPRHTSYREHQLSSYRF